MTFNNWINPLADLEGSLPKSLTLLPFQSQWNIRCNPEAPEFSKLTEALNDEGFPLVPNTVFKSKDGIKVLWLGPDEWLVVAGENLNERIQEAKNALAELHCSVIDVSANRVQIQVSGPSAEHILMKCCDFDVHPTVFKVGAAVQTNLAKAQIILEKSEENVFCLYVRNSFARYVVELLVDAAREFED